MAAKNFYDTVLVGLDLATLLAGALLSKRGFRVLVIGHGQPWPSYVMHGVRFPRAPFALTGYESPVLARVFSELAMRPTIQRRTRPLAPAFQAVLPGHRIDFGQDERALARELAREFPAARRFADELRRAARDSGAQLDRLLERDLMWPPDGFFERREFTRAAAHTPFASQPAHHDHGDSSLLEAEVDGARPLAKIFELAARTLDAGAQPTEFSARSLRLLDSLLSAAELDEGGLSGLFELLIESIRTHNGSLRLTERVDGLTVKRGAISGLHLFPSDEEIGCHHLLWGLPVARLGALLPDGVALAPLFAEVGEPRPEYARFTLNLLLDRGAVPEGMARRVLLVSGEPGREPVWVQTESTPDGQRAILTAEARISLRDGAERAPQLAGQRERLLARLSSLSPFLQEHLELIDSPHDGLPAYDVRGQSSFEIRDGSRRGPDTMETVYAYPRTRVQGAAALTVRTPIKRLFLCNGQVVPGLGLEGTFLTAWSAARAVTRSLNRDWMNRGRWTKVEL
jgi:phytoene dehydrogenase-like protein